MKREIGQGFGSDNEMLDRAPGFGLLRTLDDLCDVLGHNHAARNERHRAEQCEDNDDEEGHADGSPNPYRSRHGQDRDTPFWHASAVFVNRAFRIIVEDKRGDLLLVSPTWC